MRRNHDLSNSDIPEKITVVAFPIPCRRQRLPLNGGTQKTMAPDGMVHTVKASIHLAHHSESTDIGLHTDADPTPSTSSSTAPSGRPNIWHGTTLPLCNVMDTGIYDDVYMDDSSGAEQFMATGTEPSANFSWGEGTIFEPYIACHQKGLTKSQSVRPFLQVAVS